MSEAPHWVDRVTLSEPLDFSHDATPEQEPEPVIRCPMCRHPFRSAHKMGVHAVRELRQIIAREKDAEAERLMQRHCRRFPGEGSVWKYHMAGRQVRWAIGGTIINPDGTRESFTRRVGPNRERWTTRREAEDALATVWEDGLWNRPAPVPPVAERRPRRQAADLSVAALAREVGVSSKAIRNWESGAEPRGENARQYARALRVLTAVTCEP